MLVIILVFVSFILTVQWGTIIPLVIGMATSLIILASRVHGLQKRGEEGRKDFETQITLLKERINRLEQGVSKESVEKPAVVVEEKVGESVKETVEKTVEETIDKTIEKEREELIPEQVPVEEIAAEPIKEETPAQLKVKTDGKLIFEIPPEVHGVEEEPVPPEPEEPKEEE